MHPENLGKRERVLRIILISIAAGIKHGLQKSTCGAGVVRAAAYFNLSHFMGGFFPSILGYRIFSERMRTRTSNHVGTSLACSDWR